MKFKWVMVAVLATLFTLVSPLVAQNTPIPQAEQRFIQSWTQEIIFPVEVRFRLNLDTPPETVTRAVLSIQPETREAAIIQLDLANAVVVGGDVTVIEYGWALPVGNPPLLFRAIDFEWQATLNTGDTASIQDRLIFSDQRANWLQNMAVNDDISLTFPNGPFTVETPSANRAGVSDLQTSLRQVVSLLGAHLDRVPPFNLLIYDPTLPLCTTNTNSESVSSEQQPNLDPPCDPAVVQTMISDSGFTLLMAESSGIGAIQRAVEEYIVRESYRQQWAGKVVPAWFEAGLTRFFSSAVKSDLNAPVANAARTNNLLPPAELAVNPTDSTNTELWQSQSYGQVLYIASQIGVDGLLTFAKSLSTASSFETAYQAATGKPLSGLIDQFSRWLFTDAALSAFAFNPYQAATPSPTPSRTPTATRTPLPTNTLTLTWTPTVTGVLSRTPLPSHTPTFTPSPAPITNTPRPAGSLNTPTPVPQNAVPPGGTLSPSLMLGMIIIIAGLVLIVMTAIFLFRPKR